MALSGLTTGSHRTASPLLSFHLKLLAPPSSIPLEIPSRRSPKRFRIYCRKRPLPLPRAWQKVPQGEDNGETVGCSQFVEVVAIGSRKDAVLDFCLDSPFQSNSLRFWNINVKDSGEVQLQQRLLSEDFSPSSLEVSLFLQSCRPKAIILVASAGYGSDLTPAIDIIRSVKSANGFAIAIIVKPFSFEGQRRQDEVNYLVGALQEHAYFCIDIDTDMLLTNDVVTLDEALKTANNAVLMAINTVSVLTDDSRSKHLSRLHGEMRELSASDVFKVLQGYKQAKIGFGTGYSIRTAIVQATHQCPFLNFAVKDLNGIVLCTVACSDVNVTLDPHAILDCFCQIAGYERDVLISIIREPNLETNLLVATVTTLGCVGQQSQESNLLSKLAKRFPFVFSLLRKKTPEMNGDEGKDSLRRVSQEDLPVVETSERQIGIALDHTSQSSNVNEGSLEIFDDRDSYEIRPLSNSGPGYGVIETDFETFSMYSQAPEETPAFQREPLNTWSFGPGYVVAQEWAKERAENAVPTQVLDNLSIFRLPVGVRPSGELKNSVNISSEKSMEGGIGDDVKAQLTDSSMPSWSGLTDAGLGAVKDFYSVASTLLKGKDDDVHKKQGVLSLRAASMLEAERDSPKKWNPSVEMQYRGGKYKGRCQSGLPEGKGRLVLGDGSIYDGMWRYGKRSGSGTFYFSNGDVFQGSWRDDVIHGKGWFYFHTGDRWFVNFWKGKASGEGRFYSKSGEIFFGQFKDGWRHGHFLCIDVDGQRYVENWNEGVLINREALDSNS